MSSARSPVAEPHIGDPVRPHEAEVEFFFEREPVYLAELSAEERETRFGKYFHIYVHGQRQRVLAASRQSRTALIEAIDRQRRHNQAWQSLVAEGGAGIVHGASFFLAAAQAAKPLRNGRAKHES